MDKENKIIFLMIVISLLLACNIYTTSLHLLNYEKQKEAGNNRWQQVENRILELEEQVYGGNN